jgi:hypothetical protein
MAKKKAQDTVLALKKDSVIEYMRALRRSPAYEVMFGLLANERDHIISTGKGAKDMETRSNAMLVLEGFDRCMGMVSRWANKKTESEAETPDTPFSED